MFRNISLACVLVVLAGCAEQPTDRAQQYFGDKFSSNLNQVDAVVSDKSSDFSAFKKQSTEVIERSESMSLRYEELYTQLQKWIDESSNPALHLHDKRINHIIGIA